MDFRADAPVFVPVARGQAKTCAPRQVQGDLLIAQWAVAMKPTQAEVEASTRKGQTTAPLSTPAPADSACSTKSRQAMNLPAPLCAPAPCTFAADGLFCPACIDGLACAFHSPDFARCAPDVYRWLRSLPVERPSNTEGTDSSESSNAVCRQGDWYCPGCADRQFGRNKVCRSCGTPQEKGQAQMPLPGTLPPPPPPPPPRLRSAHTAGKPILPKRQDDDSSSTDVGGSEPSYAESDRSSDDRSPLANANVSPHQQSTKRWKHEGSWQMSV